MLRRVIAQAVLEYDLDCRSNERVLRSLAKFADTDGGAGNVNNAVKVQPASHSGTLWLTSTSGPGCCEGHPNLCRRR